MGIRMTPKVLGKVRQRGGNSNCPLANAWQKSGSRRLEWQSKRLDEDRGDERSNRVGYEMSTKKHRGDAVAFASGTVYISSTCRYLMNLP